MLTILALIALNAWSDPVRPVLVQATPPAQAEASVEGRLWTVLRLDDLMPVLQQEASREAARMEADGLIAGAGAPWDRVVAAIHDPARLRALFDDGVAGAVVHADPALLARGLDFQASDLGQRVVALEISARRAMLDEGVAEDARAAARREDGRADLIRQLIDRADLVAPNVAGGLNASIAFSRGFGQGDGFDMPLTEPQMLADAWTQRDRIEADATEWLQGFLMLAYAPLSDDDLIRYTDHAASDEGQALARLLFAGFDRMFTQTSYQMGLAAAARLQGRQL